MIKCPACEMDYDDSLTACPYCGTNSPSLSRTLMITRPNRFTGSACDCVIILNGTTLGKINCGQTIKASVTVGSNTISVISYDGKNNKRQINNYSFIVKKSSVSKGAISITIGLKSHFTYYEFIVESTVGL